MSSGDNALKSYASSPEGADPPGRGTTSPARAWPRRGTPEAIAAKITDVAHDTVISGLSLASLVAVAVAFVAVGVALLTKRARTPRRARRRAHLTNTGRWRRSSPIRVTTLKIPPLRHTPRATVTPDATARCRRGAARRQRERAAGWPRLR
ncbi:hypothetical protein GR925_04225 [Streptomyces sp. HUCO-GS316]|nr:hypothetical protein [Streptomyces sp. HUCO-GS316]